MEKEAAMTIFDSYSVDFQENPHFGRWFLIAGGVGLGIAVLLSVAMGYDRASTAVVLALWSTAMVQLIDPRTIGSQIATALIAYGGNFLIYGLLGVGVGFLVSRLRLLFKRRS
jgi:hypothetical protein